MPAPWPRRLLLCALLASGGLHALLFTLERWPSPRRLWGDEIMYADLAERGARGESAELELLWPPLYPRLLRLAALRGPLLSEPAGQPPGTSAPRDVSAARACVSLAQLALLLGAAAALHAVTRQVTGCTGTADVAAALFLLDPQLAAFAHYLWPEALHLALSLGLLALIARPRPSALACACAGLLLGLALLTKSLLLPFAPLFCLPLVATAGLRRGLLHGALTLAMAAAVVTPTIVANGRRTGAYVIADSARFNLWVGLNDRAPRNFQDEIVGAELERWRASGATFAERDARLARDIETLLTERGALRVLREQLGRQYYRLFGTPSFLTDQLPGGAIATQGYGYGAVPPWIASLLRGWHDGFYALLLMLAACALMFTAPPPTADRAPARRAWHVLAGAFLAYNLILLLWLHVKTRYRLPLLPLLDVLAALTLVRLVTRLRAPAPVGAPTLGWARCAAGALLAALLLKLAFWPPLVR